MDMKDLRLLKHALRIPALRRETLRCLLALALCFALAIGLLPAARAESGRIGIVFPGELTEPVELALYAVGEKTEGGYALYPRYASVKL